ncbi:unnamed protein product [Chondrus crispus]|uniref:Uncharacterized protein n=1 Tax=Chondrus crispus TaxID=2769 RepID=R7QMU2_CHOCR|nr:unnamed protein product [Chondrus crispus]CDF38801.1 unnamed protein product [Chondrus crispus]|eukprot:XP_005718706.1 unnamed protein product [Chondrus crispus]
MKNSNLGGKNQPSTPFSVTTQTIWFSTRRPLPPPAHLVPHPAVKIFTSKTLYFQTQIISESEPRQQQISKQYRIKITGTTYCTKHTKRRNRMSNGALRYEDSPCGIGLTSIIDLDQISDFSQEAKSIAYLQRKLNVTTREPFERDTPAHNFAISYTGSTHKFTEYGPARELLYLLTGWISHGLDPYLKYPVLGMGGKESTSDYDRMWIISEHSAARLGAGIFYSEGFWEAGFEQGSGDRTWNCRKGKDLAREILEKQENGELSFGLTDSDHEKNAFIDLMSRYKS